MLQNPGGHERRRGLTLKCVSTIITESREEKQKAEVGGDLPFDLCSSLSSCFAVKWCPQVKTSAARRAGLPLELMKTDRGSLKHSGSSRTERPVYPFAAIVG